MKIKAESAAVRLRVSEHVALLASASKQLEVEPHYPVAELIDGFTSDLYHPKSLVFIGAFSEDELRALAELYGLLCSASNAIRGANVSSVAALHKLPEWRTVMAVSNNIAAGMNLNE